MLAVDHEVLLIFDGCILMSYFISFSYIFTVIGVGTVNLTTLNLTIEYTKHWFTWLGELFTCQQLYPMVSSPIHSTLLKTSSLNQQRLFYVITTFYLNQCLLDFYTITQDCVNQVSSYFTSCSVVRHLAVLSYSRSGGTCDMILCDIANFAIFVYYEKTQTLSGFSGLP